MNSASVKCETSLRALTYAEQDDHTERRKKRGVENVFNKMAGKNPKI